MKWAKMLLLLVPFVIMGVLVEITLRTTHLFGARISWSEPDPFLGWRNSPGRTYWHRLEADHAITGRMNNFGWRDIDRMPQKETETYRIAFLGDSMVEALNVELDSTFLSISEKRLSKELNRKIELLNFGRSGMTQSEEFLVLKHHAMQFSPDMVILFFLPYNDIPDISRSTASTLMRPFYHMAEDGQLVLDTSFTQSKEFKIKSWINPMKQHSAFISLLAERYHIVKAMWNQPPVTPPGDQPEKPKAITDYISLCTENPNPIYIDNYKLNKDLINEIAIYCKSRHIPFMLVCTNTMFGPDKDAEYKEMDPSFNAFFFDEDLRGFADSIGVDYLGLQQPFRDSQQKIGTALRGHWNYAGHRLVSEELSKKLKGSVFQKNLVH